MKKVAVIMGSDSDLPIVEKGINVLKEYNVPFEVHYIIILGGKSVTLKGVL